MFTIDKTKSHSFRTLTIVTETPLPLLIEEEKGYRAREKTLVNAPIHFFRIRPTKSFLLLQTLAATGKLFFDGKQLACDFFSRLKLKYRIDQQEDTRITITPHLFDSRNEWKLIDCDLLLSGSPHIMIKGQILRCIDDDVVWSELQPQLLSMNEYEKWKEDNEYQIELQRAPQKSHIEPHPLLLLTDRTGAFANLLMDYNGLQKPFSSDPLETCYENDLIESGFQKKEVATSQYYCSVDKAFTAIDFLLDVGWRVFDSQKREIMRLTDLHIAVQQEDALRITGSAHFGEEELEITDLIQAMKRKENYIPLKNNKVGLIFKKNSHLLSLQEVLQEIEIVSGRAILKKNRLGLIEGFTSTPLSIPEVPIQNSSFQGKLRPYQQKGVDWLHFLYTNRLGGILADDMGLGKTVQVLAFLASQKAGCTLIIVPTSLLFNWQHEIATFLPGKEVYIHHGNERSIATPAPIILTSYAIVRRELAQFEQIRFNCIILDEAQAIKNSDTKTAQAIFRLQGEFRLSLTGTPIENNLLELASQFQFLQPDLLKIEEFANESLPILKKKIKPFILRRKKEEVAKDLPEKIEQTVFVEMHPEQKELYDRTVATFKSGLLKKIAVDGTKKHTMEILEAILRLRQICCHPQLVPQLMIENSPPSSSKFDAVLEDIETLLTEGKKIIIFSQFTAMLNLLSKEAKRRGWISEQLDGSTKDRKALVDRFQGDPELQLFLISLKAGGVGLNLTKADYVLLYDPWWNEAVERQAIDRAHRIGREATVIAKRYVTKDSIEENILELQARKRQLADTLFDDTSSLASLTIEELENLLK